MVDLSRGITRIGAFLPARQGAHGVDGARAARAARSASSATARSAARSCAYGEALGMRVLVTDPYVNDVDTDAARQAARASPTTSCRSRWPPPRPRTSSARTPSRKMKDGAYLHQRLARQPGGRGGARCARSIRAASPAARWTSAARRTRCRRRALAARADVIATPHTAGLTPPAIEHQSMETVAQAAEILQGPRAQGRGQRAALDAQGAASEMKHSGWLQRRGLQIYYEVAGKGPALVFAHGLGGNHLSWWQQVAHFAPRSHLRRVRASRLSRLPAPCRARLGARCLCGRPRGADR